MQRSMLTLLQIMTTDGWIDVARTFLVASPLTSVIVVIFLVFSALILMNLLAAIYVDKLLQLTDEETAREKEELEKKKIRLMEKMEHIFLDFDEDGNVVLTSEEIQKAMATIDKDGNGIVDANELAVTFQAAGLEKEDLVDLMNYFAVFQKSKLGATDEIDYTTFINGMFAMNNPSTRKDTLEILAEVKNSMSGTNCDVRLKSMESAIQVLKCSTQALDKKMDLILQELQKRHSL